MLFVNHDQTQVLELNPLLNQGMGPDDQMGCPRSNVTENGLSRFTCDTAGEKRDPVAGTVQKLAKRLKLAIVLKLTKHILYHLLIEITVT